VARIGDRRGAYRALGGGRPEEKSPLGRPRCRWEIILKWIFRKWDVDMHWIDLARNRVRWRALVNAAMSPRVP